MLDETTAHLPVVPLLKLSFDHKNFRENPSLGACFCWDSKRSLREMDKKIKFGGTIVCETLT